MGSRRGELPVILVRARAPLEPKALQEVLAGWGADDLRRQALEDVMDLCFGEFLGDLERRDVRGRDRDYAAGGVAALRYLDARMRELAVPEAARRGG